LSGNRIGISVAPCDGAVRCEGPAVEVKNLRMLRCGV